MLKTTLICCRDSIYLLPSVVSGLVWVGLIHVCVSSAAACVAFSSEDILGNVGRGLLGITLWCQRLAPFPDWGFRMLGRSNVAPPS